MDPLSLAGLGLSTASLAFQLFAGCIKGFVLLSTAQNLGRDSSTLICMLNLQEVQLTEWARRAGLLDEPPVLEKRLNETVISRVLKELQDLLLNTGKLKSRYKLNLIEKSYSDNSHGHDPSSSFVKGVLGNALSDQLRGDIMYRAHLIQARNNFPRRLWWAAIDKQKFEDYLEMIKSFVHELWRLLDPFQQDDMAQRLQIILSHVISMSERIDELSSLRDALKQSSMPATLFNHETNNSALVSIAEIKSLAINVADTTANPHRTNVQSTHGKIERGISVESVGCGLLDLDQSLITDFVPIKNNPQNGIAIYQGANVFVEWKIMPAQFRSKIMLRARNLALLLSAPKHPDFRSLQCRGLARDGDGTRVAFVFSLPAITPNQHIRALRNLFGITPSVTHRLELALQLTQSLKCFHTAGWLHKDLRSENILLLPSAESRIADMAPLCNPLLAGFAFSRLDSPSEISEQPSSNPQHDIYRHPEAMGEPSESFAASKDIYSLGAILLEIGEWRSLKSLVEKIVDVNKADVTLIQLAKVRPYLLNDGPKGGLGMLKYRMGDIYVQVTKMMLSGEVPKAWQSGKDATIISHPDLLDMAIHQLKRCVI
ncbi:MAG: hypothetical protein Q9217_003522 [Psora testacea]